MTGLRRSRLSRIISVVAAIAAGLAAWGCQERDHSNPFDPLNPDSHGVPELLEAHAANRRVDLSWDLGRIEGIESIDILRRTLDGGVEIVVNPIAIAPSVRDYSDAGVENGVTYEYRLGLRLASGGHLATAADPATPGDAIPWICDSEGGGLSRLTADARHPLESYGGGLWFLDVAADSLHRTIWAVEYLGGTVYEFEAGGERLLERSLEGARAVAVDSAGVWVGSFDTGRIERRSFDGSIVASDTTGGHIEALHSHRAGEVWVALAEGIVQVCTQAGNRMRFTRIDGFIRPVAVTSSGGKVFVLDRGASTISRFDPAGILEGRSPGGLLVAPTDIAPDGAGGVWVCDPGSGGLVRFDSSFDEIVQVPIGAVLGVTWDRGRIWAVGLMGVRILDRNGTVISGLEIGPRPIRAAVLHHP